MKDIFLVNTRPSNTPFERQHFYCFKYRYLRRYITAVPDRLYENLHVLVICLSMANLIKSPREQLLVNLYFFLWGLFELFYTIPYIKNGHQSAKKARKTLKNIQLIFVLEILNTKVEFCAHFCYLDTLIRSNETQLTKKLFFSVTFSFFWGLTLVMIRFCLKI